MLFSHDCPHGKTIVKKKLRQYFASWTTLRFKISLVISLLGLISKVHLYVLDKHKFRIVIEIDWKCRAGKKQSNIEFGMTDEWMISLAWQRSSWYIYIYYIVSLHWRDIKQITNNNNVSSNNLYTVQASVYTHSTRCTCKRSKNNGWNFEQIIAAIFEKSNRIKLEYSSIS